METLQRTANRGSVSTGFDIDNSVKLEDDNTEYLQRPASGSDGSRRTMTISMWLKRTEIDDDQIFISQGSNIRFRFKPNYFHIRLTNGSSTYEIEDQNRLFRDTSAWYHLVVAIDTTQSTASNRVKIYWNGVQHTSFTTANYPSQNDDLTLGNFSATTMQLGWFTEGGYGFNGYFAEVHYVDGTQVAQTEFGEFDDDSGIWKPKEYTGGHGSEGFYLKFKDSSNLGLDSSGNSNNFNLNNITAADQATDTPTNNFTTWNTIRYFNQGTTVFKEGGTVIDNNFAGGFSSQNNNIRVNKGKWYAEFEILETGSYLFYGIIDADYIDNSLNADFYLGSQANGTAGVGFYASNNSIYRTGDFESAGVTSAAGDIVGVALDCDNNKVHFALNNTWTNSSNPATNANGWATTGNDQYFASSSLGDKEYKSNFGGYTADTISSAATDANGYGTFEYAPPSGYYALCTKNLAEYG
jgi:hypothetical protein